MKSGELSASLDGLPAAFLVGRIPRFGPYAHSNISRHGFYFTETMSLATLRRAARIAAGLMSKKLLIPLSIPLIAGAVNIIGRGDRHDVRPALEPVAVHVGLQAVPVPVPVDEDDLPPREPAGRVPYSGAC